jgi:alanine dehydrogenase
MKIGIISTSTKKNEKRYPLHHSHIRQLKDAHLKNLIFEIGYPGIDQVRRKEMLNLLPRKEIFEMADLIILAKPTPADFPFFRPHQILWGWPHCVQNPGITDIGIKNNMTFIAWEAMFKWRNNVKQEHIFSRNNELAGYSSVIHALTHHGLTGGVYGQPLKAAVIGYGSTGKGAVNALLGLGAHDITVYSKRSRFEVADAITHINYKRYRVEGRHVYMNGNTSAQELSSYDIIVNCILQNPLNPIAFMTNDDAINLDKKQLIIDVSCDKAMGFEFARPTDFQAPTFEVGPVTYYGVNHSPTYFWQSASYELSGALLPYLEYMLDHGTYKGNIVLEKAVAIEEGIIKNMDIIMFQRRNDEYPYDVINKKD